MSTLTPGHSSSRPAMVKSPGTRRCENHRRVGFYRLLRPTPYDCFAVGSSAGAESAVGAVGVGETVTGGTVVAFVGFRPLWVAATSFMVDTCEPNWGLSGRVAIRLAVEYTVSASTPAFAYRASSSNRRSCTAAFIRSRTGRNAS